MGEAYAEKAAEQSGIHTMLQAGGESAAGLDGDSAGRHRCGASVSVHPRVGVGSDAGLCADLRGLGAASSRQSGEVTA